MARKPVRRKTTKKKNKAFHFQLSYTGLAGVAVVTFCIFIWMFILGIWAGQTILFPVDSAKKQRKTNDAEKEIRTLEPSAKKKPISELILPATDSTTHFYVCSLPMCETSTHSVSKKDDHLTSPIPMSTMSYSHG